LPSAIAPDKEFRAFPDSPSAWAAAWSAATVRDLVCVTGSVFLAGELQDSVRACVA